MSNNNIRYYYGIVGPLMSHKLMIATTLSFLLTFILTIGYNIVLGQGENNVKDEASINGYLPTTQEMTNPFQMQGEKENSDNSSLVPETKTSPTADVVLLSQRLVWGNDDYNDIVGQVRNIGSDSVELVRIGLTVYDKNGDIVGTGSSYAEATTLEPNQKSSFDIHSNKDNFDDMESYVLSLQWKTSDGTKQYVENVQVYDPRN